MTRFNRLGKRLQARVGARWRKNTLENTFGLTVQVCPECRSLNPRPVGKPPHETCAACGAALDPAAPTKDPREVEELLAEEHEAERRFEAQS